MQKTYLAKASLLLGFFVLFSPISHLAAQSKGKISVNKSLLKGRWQLVQTFTMGATHKVVKEDYDGVITFKAFHQYTEEIHYESNHWIIEGKWHLNYNSAALELTKRKYLTGGTAKLDDIILKMEFLDKQKWSASSADKGGEVKVFYEKTGK